ncbi:hypothetical protein AWC38_SpisGene11929 [Stylophora pistillata]|uniref:DUF6589 domain-containing protein n=1 Tax=Stylophora pistillata TaxID=50429 RepID=A0A2B4S4S8_STYPI|nr:hypothetical protein AWC38_SpisGene11929 [Stylophora pistillata]
MMKNVRKGNYRAAANATLSFPPFQRELVKELIQLIRKELKTYSQGPSAAKYNGDPLSLKEYSNESLLEEAEANLPGPTNIIKKSAKSAKTFAVNKQALALSSALKTWIPRSNFVYRLNTLLIDGGCKTEAMDLLHRLVKDRVHACPSFKEQPQKSLGIMEMKEFLPTPEVQLEFVADFKPLILRVLVEYLPAYKDMTPANVSHIPHKHSKEMGGKSEVFCLGLEFQNSNAAAKMAVIIEKIQEKFVPAANINGKKEILEKVILDGDQLTEERARNAKIANIHADSSYEKLSGLQTSFADWHLGKNLLDIFFKLFAKESSATEIGTSYASMNRSGKTNARKGPEKDYNSYKDFFDRQTEAHIVAAWMQFSGMAQIHDKLLKSPTPPEAETWNSEQKRHWLYLEIDKFLEEHLSRANDVPE